MALIPCVDLCCLQTHADPGRCPEVFGGAAFQLISPSEPELALCLWQGEHVFWEKRGSAAVFLSALSLGRARKTQLQCPNYSWTQQQCRHSPCPRGYCFPRQELYTQQGDTTICTELALNYQLVLLCKCEMQYRLFTFGNSAEFFSLTFWHD